MKITKKEKSPFRIPEVGETWSHDDDSSIYMRIIDEDGMKVNPSANVHEAFFSIDLHSCRIVNTDRNTRDIIIIDGSFVV